MKILYALRHAKAAAQIGAMHDHERPLNEQGIEAARLVGGYCASRKWLPDTILCSSAVRTRQTAEQLQAAMNKTLPVSFLDRLYLAEPRELFSAVQDIDDACESAMIIGHNPGIHNFAQELASTGDSEALDVMEFGFPTASLAVIEINIKHWRDIKPKNGRLLHFIQPRNLALPGAV